MRVDFTPLGVEPPDNTKTGRAGQKEASGTGASNSSASTSRSISESTFESTSGGISGSDQARFSYDQTRVQSLKTQVLAQPDIRETRVQSLQQAIGSGEYSVPPSDVADSLVNELGTGTSG